ncbi:hypothetical protein NPIL_482651 [Nephila pilipes]|uniref:Uncharacterized protein n=1 Tax=Nephila pilipes TaxID=299642 RepID=A0A8X6TP25_NEPPI|nr:hypothetical protein NPIL_482651 [Nephila pilipes]
MEDLKAFTDGSRDDDSNSLEYKMNQCHICSFSSERTYFTSSLSCGSSFSDSQEFVSECKAPTIAEVCGLTPEELKEAKVKIATEKVQKKLIESGDMD